MLAILLRLSSFNHLTIHMQIYENCKPHLHRHVVRAIVLNNHAHGSSQNNAQASEAITFVMSFSMIYIKLPSSSRSSNVKPYFQGIVFGNIQNAQSICKPRHALDVDLFYIFLYLCYLFLLLVRLSLIIQAISSQ